VKRLFSTANLIDAALIALAILVSAGTLCAQDPPPEPAAMIVGPPYVLPGKIVRLSVQGAPKDSKIVWDVLPRAAVDMEKLAPDRLNFTAEASNNPFQVRVWVLPPDGGELILDFDVLIAPRPPIPPGPIPVVLTLRDLAGAKAQDLRELYAGLALLVENGSLDDVAHFHRTEATALENRKLTGHGATTAIAKRLNVKTLDELKAPLAKIVEELGAPPTPPPNPIPNVDDPWKVGETARGILSSLSPEVKAQTRATAELYLKAAAGLEDGTYPSIGEAAKWLQAERKKLWGANAAQWSPFESAVSDVWNKAWPMLKGDVAKFYRATAAGIGAVN
jgi:hypothetical protein